MTLNLTTLYCGLNINTILLQYLPLIIAIVAGFIAIHKIHLTHNANYRLKWIEGFRNAISTLICEVNDYSVTLSKIVLDGRKSENNDKNEETDMERFQNAIKNSTKYLNETLLFLNPNDKRHIEIIKCIDTIESACKNPNSEIKIEDFTTYVGQHFEKLIELSQIEISRQWKKSRRWI